MFAAALLDVRSGLWPRCEAAIAAMGLAEPLRVARQPHGDGVLTGSRFVVEGVSAQGNGQDQGQGQGQRVESHTHWRDIRGRLERAPLDGAVREAALGIFELLAGAEAAVHGKDPDEVAFHEVGALDSIVDILVAAAIITALTPCIWTVGALPRGRGQVRTLHGFLPVPAPAVLELLKGYTLVDDGEEGERITPTGAAILRYLGASQAVDSSPRGLIGAGIGFGTRKFASRSNILRATLYGPAADSMAGDSVEVLRCEIDDQTAEDLAVAIDHLRAAEGVIDVCQWPVFGKKGRMGTALQVLAAPGRAAATAALILDETTTLGVRRATQSRMLVAREAVNEGGLPVKLAHRPGGVTAKAEMDALAATRGVSVRQRKRYEAELKAIQEKDTDGQ
ncbi:MAG: LarC family nickel insertion protein [Proteobacteria bacterium]|nr:LarC family nickel insertion protein [Pseudomonadota bacterium]